MIVGEALFGESSYRGGLERQVAGLGLSGRVEFRGRSEERRVGKECRL